MPDEAVAEAPSGWSHQVDRRLAFSGSADRGGAGRSHRIGQVLPVQRPVRHRPGSGRRHPADHLGAAGGDLGRASRPRICWTGCRCRDDMRWRAPGERERHRTEGRAGRAGAARPARPRLDREGATSCRSTGWCSWSTSWSGWSTRRSTPTPLLHERYLRPLAEHAAGDGRGAQPDRPADAGCSARPVCATSAGCSTRRGWQRTEIRAASAETGEGLPALRELIAARVADKLAAARRLAADVSTAADRLAGGVG